MGSQQMLLIAIGVIIVGIAIALANGTMNGQAEQRTKDNIILECTNLAADALKYYRTNTAMGGGGNSFSGWEINSRLDTTLNGTYSKVLADHALIITGRPLESSGYNWCITTRVEDSEVVSSETRE